jgi:superfamily I DNA/RNA helicase
MITGTKQQEAIWHELANGKGDVIVNAGAGTGKTFTIVEGGNRANGNNMAFLCFNKSIATELAERLPEGVEAKTFHALGFAAIRSAGIRTKVNNWKVKNFINDILGKDYQDTSQLCKLISLVKGSLVDGNDRKSILQIIDAYNINFNSSREEEMALNNIPVLLEMCKQNTSMIDFDDMIWLPIVKRGREVKEFSLSLTWRCPKSVVKEANRFVADFDCKEDAIEGKVVEKAPFNPEEGDMVLCRYNAPLVSAFYELIMQGKSAYVLGRDMTKGLVNAVNKITKNNNMGSDEFLELLEVDFRYNYDRLISLDKTNQAHSLEDKYECIRIFATKASTVGGIIAEIKRVFDGNEKGEIMLSTVHKAKGLEADNVYILATERMPHPKATDMREEMNICYVAITRAKKNLYYCGPKPAQ